MKAYKDGVEVKRGDKVVDFRGDEWTFVMVTRAPATGKSAKVKVCGEHGTREFYERVFDLEVR